MFLQRVQPIFNEVKAERKKEKGKTEISRRYALSG